MRIILAVSAAVLLAASAPAFAQSMSASHGMRHTSGTMRAHMHRGSSRGAMPKGPGGSANIGGGSNNATRNNGL